MHFEILKQSSQTAARTGRITLGNARLIETPAFMPVGTQATVKAMKPEDLRACGIQMILCNTYHLMMRPGEVLIKNMGGLHRFMNWSGGILTDSGGFQVYSLALRRKVDEGGVTFQSHIDGKSFRLDPMIALDIQLALGSDIAMVLDECVELPNTKEIIKHSVDRTLKWAKISKKHLNDNPMPAVFGIGQGGNDPELRRYCAQALCEMEFPGYALGGFAVGEPAEQTWDLVAQCAAFFPPEKPRYLMGVGTPEDLVRHVGSGVDLFDCVLPTRNGRNGQAFTSLGKVNIANAVHAQSDQPLDANCACSTCKQYSRAYLRHLFLAKEILASMLLTQHNLTFYQNLMKNLRQAIQRDQLHEFSREFLQLQKVGGSG